MLHAASDPRLSTRRSNGRRAPWSVVAPVLLACSGVMTDVSAEDAANPAPQEIATLPMPRPVAAPPPRQRPVPGDAPTLAPPPDQPRPQRRLPPSCTADGAHCIRQNGYVRGVCRTIEALATENDLDAGFFARLVWKESLFDADAVSHAGALGIAQFMPETATLRALDDPLNPAKALRASAIYLADLRRRFGNLGLAAAAYNGGENRMARFVRGEGRMPLETRAYVRAITGHSVDDWRSAPPQDTDFTLKKGMPFEAACTDLASRRIMRQYRIPDELMPWVVVLAVNIDGEAVRARIESLSRRFPAEMDVLDIRFGRTRLPGKRQVMATALIGAPSETRARGLCTRLRAARIGCMALRNSGYYEPVDCADCERPAIRRTTRGPDR